MKMTFFIVAVVVVPCSPPRKDNKHHYSTNVASMGQQATNYPNQERPKSTKSRYNNIIDKVIDNNFG